MRPSRRRPTCLFVMFLAFCQEFAGAQSLPPVPDERARESAAQVAARNAASTAAAEIAAGETPEVAEARGVAAAAAAVAVPVAATARPFWLPLKKASSEDVLAFYGRDGGFNPADNIKFLYGFTGGQRKGLSADLVGLLFPGGVRLAIGSSVASGGEPSTGAPSTEDSIQRLREGGDMYIAGAYPLLAGKTTGLSGHLFFVPRVNFLIDGFGSTQTVTEATESTSNIGIEAYVQLLDIENKGGAFLFTRWGHQHVSEAFKNAAKLADQNFGVFEIAIGAQFGDLLRVSFQRFQAPAAAAGVSVEKLKGWHLVVQLAPTKK